LALKVDLHVASHHTKYFSIDKVNLSCFQSNSEFILCPT
ncbi:MAG: hypothetical protein ACI9EA_001700, partial [Pseudomonadales bacterium]